ncbi:MAG: hypothetical protein GY870_03965 [archaeon]|nr:hypothetical protein [archaeon]
MIPNQDLCPHGNPFYDCQTCQVEMKMKAPIDLKDNPLNWEFSIPHAPLGHDMTDTLSKQLISTKSSLEDRIITPIRPSGISNGLIPREKSLFEQRNELINKKLPGQQELENATKMVDIEKKFMRKK